MNAPSKFEQVVGGKKYSVAKAELIAGDDYWDGHNYERWGRNTFLYRTKKGNYFTLTLTCHQGERDYIQPLSIDEAVTYYEEFDRKGDIRVEFEKAFPDYVLEEA